MHAHRAKGHRPFASIAQMSSYQILNQLKFGSRHEFLYPYRGRNRQICNWAHGQRSGRYLTQELPGHVVRYAKCILGDNLPGRRPSAEPQTVAPNRLIQAVLRHPEQRTAVRRQTQGATPGVFERDIFQHREPTVERALMQGLCLAQIRWRNLEPRSKSKVISNTNAVGA